MRRGARGNDTPHTVTRTSLLLLALAGCSGAAADVTAMPAADASLDAPASDAALGVDAPETDVALGFDASARDVSLVDVATTPDVPIDAPAPHPPAGAHRCGMGEITPSDASAACMAPNLFVDATERAHHGRSRAAPPTVSVDRAWRHGCGGARSCAPARRRSPRPARDGRVGRTPAQARALRTLVA